MTFEEQASELKIEEIAAVLASRALLEKENSSLERENTTLKEQLAWYKRQVFGKKSERRIPEESKEQKRLFEREQAAREQQQRAAGAEEKKIQVASHTRIQKSNKKTEDDVEAPAGTFPEHLHREEVLIDEKPSGYSDEELEVISEKVTERLAENPGEPYVIEHRRRVFKVKETGEIITAPAPEHVFGQRCKVDESFLVLMAIKKFLWHLPLYRQHQMLKLEGILLSRGSLSNWVIQLAELLEPIACAVKEALLSAEYLHIDNTPGQVGRGKKRKEKTYGTGYFWPLLNPEIGVHFSYSKTKAYKSFEPLVSGFKGTLVSDAEEIFEKFTTAYELPWQLCWHHSRRNFLEAESQNPELAAQAIQFIRELYRVEREIKEAKVTDPEKVSFYRQKHTQPVLNEFRQWLRVTAATPEALTSDKLSQAIAYLYTRWDAAVLFVMNGSIPPDNGADERQVRPLKLGFKNYLFCASEVGAECAAVFYTLIASAKMHGIHPYYYLMDILRRIDQKGITAQDLIPHKWKEKFLLEAVPPHLQKLIS